MDLIGPLILGEGVKGGKLWSVAYPARGQEVHDPQSRNKNLQNRNKNQIFCSCHQNFQYFFARVPPYTKILLALCPPPSNPGYATGGAVVDRAYTCCMEFAPAHPSYPSRHYTVCIQSILKCHLGCWHLFQSCRMHARSLGYRWTCSILGCGWRGPHIFE